jgi:lambda repressor-like predicted transcriptional regulator
MAYSQLTLNQRQKIQELHRKGSSQAAIARQIGVHRSTVKRELDRNSKEGEYQAVEAQAVTLYRKRMAGTISQLGKTKKPLGFRWKLREAFWLKKNYPEDLKERKPGRLTFLPKRKRKNHSQSLRAQKYSPRKDDRNYKLHANKKRPKGYRLWKSRYESHFRFRDNAKAEMNRIWRTGIVFQRYYRSVVPFHISHARKIHLRWRKFKRERYEQAMREFQRRMDQLNQELMEIRLGWEQEEIQDEIKKVIQKEAVVIEEQVQPFFFIWWYVNPDIQRKVFLLSG